MTNLRHTWPKEAFEAIDIKASDCRLNIQGTDEDQIVLDGNVDEKHFRGFRQGEEGPRLKIFLPHDHNSALTLKLPSSKAWVTLIFAGKADIGVTGIRSRLQIMAGKGEIYIEDLEGSLTVASGNADIRVRHFKQAAMPEIPPQEPGLPEFPKPLWGPSGETEWEDWGHSLGEKIGWWALDFSRYFDRSAVSAKEAGIGLQTGKGEIELTDIEAKTGLIRLSNGNLKLQGTYIQNLDLGLSHGNIEGKSLVPGGDWTVKTSHGNIRLSLAANISARLDMATRNGNIHSATPLVRVSHQGPETYYGKRMVGTIGPKIEGTLPELRVVATQGNIDIDSDSQESNPEVKPGTDLPSRKTEVCIEEPEGSAETVRTSGNAADANSSRDNTPQTVLESLREGKISVAEAEELLKRMSL